MTLEVDAVAGFFEWQHTDIDFSRDDSVLGITKGNHVPVLFYDGQPVAHGYFDIIDYWRNKGYCLR
jgi:hypothetical protein